VKSRTKVAAAWPNSAQKQNGRTAFRRLFGNVARGSLKQLKSNIKERTEVSNGSGAFRDSPHRPPISLSDANYCLTSKFSGFQMEFLVPIIFTSLRGYFAG
jgi:hypothetical protein